MPSRDIKLCVPQLQLAWTEAESRWASLHPNLPKPFLTCTYRSNAEQSELYAQGRTKKGPKVTNAKAGQSAHNLNPSKAFDIAFKTDKGELDWSPKLFKMFSDIIKPLGVEWGGDFRSIPDSPHFQVK